jgi:hypothetical protein
MVSYNSGADVVYLNPRFRTGGGEVSVQFHRLRNDKAQNSLMFVYLGKSTVLGTQVIEHKCSFLPPTFLTSILRSCNSSIDVRDG